jgi:hypothetical protein
VLPIFPYILKLCISDVILRIHGSYYETSIPLRRFLDEVLSKSTRTQPGGNTIQDTDDQGAVVGSNPVPFTVNVTEGSLHLNVLLPIGPKLHTTVSTTYKLAGQPWAIKYLHILPSRLFS